MNTEELRQELKNLNDISKQLMHCQSIDEVVRMALVEVRKQLNSYAALSGADLRNADLRGADLSYARVENAMFRNNQGIDERLRFSLIERGANLYPIIESEIPDNNMIAYRKLK